MSTIRLSIVVGWLTVATAWAQVTGDRVDPHWFDGNNQFWYRVDLPEQGRRFVRVDAVAGTRQPAFDHARVAQALSEVLGRTVTADHLPVEALVYDANDPNWVTLRSVDRIWRWNPREGTLVAGGAADVEAFGLPFDRRVRPSLRTGESTTITFVNRLDRSVVLHWVDNGGQPTAYGTLEPGQRRQQHTYGGHIWMVTDANEALLAVFEAPDEGGLAVIDRRVFETPRRRRGRGGRRRPRSDAVDAPSPDGRWVAFVRDHNLMLRATDANEVFALTTDANESDSYHADTYRERAVGMNYNLPEAPATLPRVLWSGDGEYLIAFKTRKVPERTVYLVNSSPRDQLQPRLESYPYLKPGDPIPVGIPHLFSTRLRREIALQNAHWWDQPWDLSHFEWSPDGRRFVFLVNQRGHQVMRVVEVEAATGASRLLVDEVCETFFDYSSKTYLDVLWDSNELIWMSERSGTNHLYRVDMTTGRVKNPITQGPWVVRSVERVDPEQRLVWFQALGQVPGQDPLWEHVCRIRFDGSGLVRLTAGAGTHRVQWSPDRRFLLDTYSRVDDPPHTVLRDADGRLICPLEDADASALLATGRRLPTRFVAPGRDGVTPIYGIIHWPLDFDPNRSYPVIENIYAGPHGAHVPKGFRESYRQWDLADRGFIVVQIDGMGTNWRSRAFHDVCWKNLVDAGLPDRIAWMRAAAKAYPCMDLERVGIYGGSAGGQNALGALLTHGDFYRVGVADCGCHDNRLDKVWWNEQWMGYPVGPHYEAQSNVTLAPRLQGDLLLVLGELDRNVDPSSTMQVVDALVRADKDFDLLIIPGAGHGATGTPYGWRRLCDFFVEHLKP